MSGTLTADGAFVELDGAILANNTWGRGDLVNGRDYRQSVAYGDSLADGVRFDWAWPDAAEGVRAYPELFAGRKPWGPQTGGDLLPLPLSRTQGLTLSVDLDWGGESAGFNVALDMWVADGPQAGPEGTSHEIMVWLKPGAARPAGAAEGRLAAGDIAGPLYVREGHGGGWTYLALVSDRPVASGEIEIGALIAALTAQGRLPEDGWLLSLELGAEVVRGAGWLEVREFAPALRETGAETRQPVADPTLITPDPG